MMFQIIGLRPGHVISPLSSQSRPIYGRVLGSTRSKDRQGHRWTDFSVLVYAKGSGQRSLALKLLVLLIDALTVPVGQQPLFEESADS